MRLYFPFVVGGAVCSLFSALPLFAQPSASPPTLSVITPSALAVPITVRAEGQSLDELLRSLKASPRPELQAKTPLGGQRVTVFARNQPLQRIMRGLKTLFNADWIPNASEPPSRYHLIPNRNSAEYEQELYRLTLERGAEPMFRLTAYLKTSQEEFARQDTAFWQQHIEPADPLLKRNLFYLARSGPRFGLNLLTTLSSDQRFALLSEGQYTLSQDVMNDRQRRLTHGMALAAAELQQKIGRLLEGETPEDKAQITDDIGLVLYAQTDPVTGAFKSFSYSSGAGGLFVATTATLPPPIPLLPVRGNPYNFRLDRKSALPVYPKLQQMRFPEVKFEQGTEYTWRETLAELAKHLTLPLYSDDFSYTTIAQDRIYAAEYEEIDPKAHPLAARPQLSTMNLQDGLDALCKQYGYLWWSENGALFFRSRTWFIEQLYEVPPPVLALVRKQLETEGKLNADGVTALSTLTKKQMIGLSGTNRTYNAGETERREQVGARSYDTQWRGMSCASAQHTWADFQIYVLLSDAEKNRVVSSEGLPFLEMNRAAQRAAFHTLYAQQSLRLMNDPAKLRFQFWQRSSPPVRAHAPCQASVGFSLDAEGSYADVPIRYTPSETKAAEQKPQQESNHHP